MPKAKSKKQAALLGAIAGGAKPGVKGISPTEARERLRGVDVKKLPYKTRKKGGK